MRIRESETQEISNICREEFEEAAHRVSERLKQYEVRPASSNDEHLEGVRKFYEDLANKNWTKADEEALKNLDGKNESDIKAMMREGFRKAGSEFRLSHQRDEDRFASESRRHAGQHRCYFVR
jgi:hypothetical protein